jgi:nucleotide-binding universal stress UspA family protein
MMFCLVDKEKELRKKEEELRELQEVYESRLLQLKIDYEWVTGSGSSPGDHIVSTAVANRCEMIVMGARGLGAIKRALLGSVSDHVIRKAKVPVLICKWDS